MHFVKFVSGMAPGSRWDIACQFEMDDFQEEEEEEDEDQPNAKRAKTNWKKNKNFEKGLIRQYRNCFKQKPMNMLFIFCLVFLFSVINCLPVTVCLPTTCFSLKCPGNPKLGYAGCDEKDQLKDKYETGTCIKESGAIGLGAVETKVIFFFFCC